METFFIIFFSVLLFLLLIGVVAIALGTEGDWLDKLLTGLLLFCGWCIIAVGVVFTISDARLPEQPSNPTIIIIN